MDIRPLRTEKDYQEALDEIQRLLNAVSNSAEADRFEVLTTLVEAYEDNYFPIPEPDPVEAIRYFMTSRGLTRKDLEPYLGDGASVAQVLKRKRRLSITMIRKLHNGLGISADLLIQPYTSA